MKQQLLFDTLRGSETEWVNRGRRCEPRDCGGVPLDS